MIKLENAVKYDPTRTLTLRKAFVAKTSTKFKQLKSKIKRFFGEKITGFGTKSPEDKLNDFNNWVKSEINDGILELKDGILRKKHWSEEYIEQAYKKGVSRARIEVSKKAKINVLPVSMIFDQGVHMETVALLHTRTFSELKGVTEAMSQNLSRVFVEGMIEGKNANAIAKDINEKINGIGIRRARIMARTEIVRAHHLASIKEYRKLGVENVKVLAEWNTAGDGRVCPKCKPKDGVIYTLDEIENKIPLHPQCRCVALPYFGDD